MNRSKKTSSPKEEIKKDKYEFSKVFNIKFDALVKAYSESLESLNKMSSGKIDCDYGVCATSYHTRFISPKDISTFVDNLVRAIEGGFFHDNMNDINMFMVASVKKFFEDNGSEPIDDDAADETHDHVDPRAQTLQDLEMVCANDYGPVAVYSKGEIVQRIKLAADDVKKMNDMHYAANAKKLVGALPKILNDTCIYSMAIMKAIFQTVEDFLLFATTVNTCTVLQMYAYCNPATDYSFKKVKKEDSDEENVVTECCMCKTNDYMIRNRIPFNCNMRDVILQDMTPDFKDTHDALHFILKDGRSPISVLVARYAPKDAGRNFHGGDAIARMFLGVGRCPEHCLDDVFKKDGDRVDVDPLDDVAGFQTKVDWLDTIAFGNNYLDGNYRRDAVGNNHVHPITNSLDMIFKMYGGIDLKSNEELAENIICVAGAIRGIVHAYRDGAPIENCDLTKDVLVLLGEILTRNILRLYYNNTQVVKYTDDNTNAAAPGFIGESYIQEADATGSDTGSKEKEAAYGGVTFTDGNGNEIKPTNVDGIKKLMAKIANWFKSIFSQFGNKARENLSKYIDAIKKNEAINKEIGDKFNSNSFNAHLKDYKLYHIKGDKFNAAIPNDLIGRYINGENIEFNKLVLMMLGIPEGEFGHILTAENSNSEKTNWKDIATKSVEYFYFDGWEPNQRYYTGKMDSKKWEDAIGDIVGAPAAIDAAVKAFNEKGSSIQKTIDAKLNEQNLAPEVKKRLETLSQAYQKAFTELARTITTAIINPIVKERYALYLTVLQNYKNQAGSSTNANAETPTQVTTEPPAENAGANATNIEEGGNQNA